MAHVFINYARPDLQFVEQLSEKLRRDGIDVWYDSLKISPGTQWPLAIQDAVKSAGVLLQISTPSANTSEWVRLEAYLALQNKIPVIPLVVLEPPKDPMLQAIQWIDFRSNPDQAYQNLLKALPPNVRSAVPLQEERPKSKGYVFISYAEEDAAFIGSLVAFLRERGYGYWIYQESDRNYHIEIFLELDETIKNAAATISVLSPDWKRSKWAPREFIYSEEVGTPVFLVMAQPMEPTTLIAGRPYIDCYHDLAGGFTRLDQALRRMGLI